MAAGQRGRSGPGAGRWWSSGARANPWVIDIIRVEPQGYVSFRWASSFAGAAPVPGNSTLVEFYVRPVGDETGVIVVESGFAGLDLPDALREDQLRANTGGWVYEMACGPASSSWNPRKTGGERRLPQGGA